MPSAWKDDILANIDNSQPSDNNFNASDKNLINFNTNWNEHMNFRNDFINSQLYPTPPTGYIPNRRKFDFLLNGRMRPPTNWNTIPNSNTIRNNMNIRPEMPSGFERSYYMPRGRSLNLDNNNRTSRGESSITETHSEFIPEHHEDWEYYHHHKDRRDLYHTLEAALELR